MEYFTGKGVAVEQLTSRGYGESQPVADNGTAEGRAENRRVELRVLN
jgi:OOP family OmpA-OmpF porin